jgi:hypothetical protein
MGKLKKRALFGSCPFFAVAFKNELGGALVRLRDFPKLSRATVRQPLKKRNHFFDLCLDDRTTDGALLEREGLFVRRVTAVSFTHINTMITCASVLLLQSSYLVKAN